MVHQHRRLLFALTAVGGLAFVALLALTIVRTPPRSPLPSPNGYDDFLRAAALLTGDVYQLSTLDHDDLRTLVSTNAETLRMLRLGLTHNCSVPTDSAMANVPGMMSDLALLKSLTRLLVVPNYLSRVPQDPFTWQPMLYRPQDTNWLLYSVGADGVDDGGKPVGRGSAKGDIFFDSSW